MQLPVDIMALIDEATNIKSARDTELSISVYIDETAPAELVAHVRGVFASTMPTVRMTLSYLDRSFYPREGDDFAVVVAGNAAKVGAATAALRAVSVPTMVVALTPAAVAKRAEDADSAIPEGDLVSPATEDGVQQEPYVLDEQGIEDLNDRMGRWIVAVCHEKRLAFAIAFPFMRRPLARESVQSTSLQNAGIGLVPFIPGADLPIITLNQAKMTLQIAAAYGHEMSKDRIKELAAVVGGAYLCRTLARELTEFIPGLGFVIRTGVAYGGTAALGNAIIEYFEGGESVTGVANVAQRATQAGTKLVNRVRKVIDDPASASAAVGRAVDYIPQLKGKAEKAIPRIVDAAADLAEKAVGAK